MYSADRYLVWWVSSVSGEHFETRHTPERANALLEEKERREHFQRGLVIDTDDANLSEEEFLERHRQYAHTVA